MLVRFAPDVRLSEIMQFLHSYSAIVTGSKDSAFRVRYGETPLSKDGGLVGKIEAEKVVSSAAPAP